MKFISKIKDKYNEKKAKIKDFSKQVLKPFILNNVLELSFISGLAIIDITTFTISKILGSYLLGLILVIMPLLYLYFRRGVN